MNLQDRILELLKGRSQHKPLLGNDLLAKTGADPDDVNDALDDLQGRGALNRVEITRGDRTFTALWPTGLVPRNLSWKEERNNGKGLMGAQLAHNVQQDAERSRQAVAIPPIPSIPKPIKEEKPMTRIARSAQIVEPVAAEKLRSPHARLDQQLNTGPVQTAILAVLKAGGVLDVDTIFNRLDVPTTKGSCGKTLETLAKRGTIEASLLFHNKRHRRFYCMPGTDRAAEPLCSELPCNLATLRRIAADDHISDSGKMVDPAEVRPEVFESDAPITRAAAVADLESDSTRFALWDNGSLLLTVGDDIVALQRADVQRLANYLKGCAGVLFAEAA